MNNKLFLCIGFFLQISNILSSDKPALTDNAGRKIPVKVFWGRSPFTAIPIREEKAKFVTQFIQNKEDITLESVILVEALIRKNKILAAMHYPQGLVLFMEFELPAETTV
jgi:hypothetical protein